VELTFVLSINIDNRLRNLEAKVFLYIKSLLFYDCKMILQAYCEYVLKTVSCILRPVFHSWELGMLKRHSRVPGNNKLHGMTPVLPNSATDNACGTP